MGAGSRFTELSREAPHGLAPLRCFAVPARHLLSRSVLLAVYTLAMYFSVFVVVIRLHSDGRETHMVTHLSPESESKDPGADMEADCHSLARDLGAGQRKTTGDVHKKSTIPKACADKSPREETVVGKRPT